MKRCFLNAIILFILAIVVAICIHGDEEQTVRDTALFRFDMKGRTVLSLSETGANLRLRFVSVTTDEPVYWPNEDVYLKVVLPAHAGAEVEIALMKKDAVPKKLGTFQLNKAGMLVSRIASGKEKKIEPGEYIAEVKTKDGAIAETATYSVVEGALGALSFAHEFDQITDPKKLENVKGGWFFGNAGGVGKRWGNGLNVKNEVRYLNRPYTGKATIQTRCYLSGCDGVEAGPPVVRELVNGLLEAVFEVGGHSGPFGIDVITDKGSVSYVFMKSGHVERRTITLTGGMCNAFSATLAPYENTTPVYGRDIYIVAEKTATKDAFEIRSVIADTRNEVEIVVQKPVANARLFVSHPAEANTMKTEEIALPVPLEKGKRLFVKCYPPYSVIAVGGFEKDTIYEGWAVVFTPSPIDVELGGRSSGLPGKPYELEVRTSNKTTGKGIAVSGILEVFDNRVQSKSAKEPLVSAIGDSVREYSNYLVTWRDYSGIDEEYDRKTYAMKDDDFVAGGAVMAEKEEMAPPSPKSLGVRGSGQPSANDTGADEVEIAAEQETIREGEKKVVYCGIVTTDAAGRAIVSIDLPPQTGRCKARFVAIDGYDYLEKVKEVDVKKSSYVEVALQPLVIPGARVVAKAIAVNDTTAPLTLVVSGAGLDRDLSFTVKPGVGEFEVPVVGGKYGTLVFRLRDGGGKPLDTREVEIRNIGAYPVTFSNISISDGTAVKVPKGGRAAVYANPGMLLNQMTDEIVTTMYSWFGHAESMSASAAIRACLLAAIDEKVIPDGGKQDTLTSDLVKTVNDLRDAFYDKNTGLFSPYPGLATNDLWSLWTAKNLGAVVTYLDGAPRLKKDLSETITTARTMIDGVKAALKKKNVNVQEIGRYDFDKGTEVIPVEIDGKVVFKVVTDSAVVDWYVKKMAPALDLSRTPDDVELNKKFQTALDTYRFLRSFERAGVYYYLSINARALYLGKSERFGEVFARIAKGIISARDPGIIRGPALTGGVYSSPACVMNFLDLLILMAKDKRFEQASVSLNGKKTALSKTTPLVIDAKDAPVTLAADRYAVIRIDEEKTIDLLRFEKEKTFCAVVLYDQTLAIGGRTELAVRLDDGIDPSEYYAIIAAPSVTFVTQTGDLLSDYKGQLIHGQRSTGGDKIQVLTVPFRGKAGMTIELEASQKGESEGFVIVRHISNPSITVTMRIPKMKVE